MTGSAAIAHSKWSAAYKKKLWCLSWPIAFWPIAHGQNLSLPRRIPLVGLIVRRYVVVLA